jgi:mannosyl-3-phosphoglycerate phosphatase
MLSNYLIFTDLDGTLLDHDNYSFADAVPMINFIKKNAIPLIIVTSKTKSEIEILQRKLDLNTPFIVENGAGIFIPKDNDFEMIPLGFEYKETRKAFDVYSKRVSIYGFYDMSTDEISKLTGLSLEDAKLAKKRTFSEPFVMQNENELETLKKMVKEDGFNIVKGGRFYHLITKNQDKAAAIREIIKIYTTMTNNKYKTIALGDSQNDLSMLKSVDVPILIPHADGDYMDCNIKNLIKAKFPGPKGWNEALKGYFDAK